MVGRAAREVKWHQDIQYWPHTNYSVLTIGVYLEDVDETMGADGRDPRRARGRAVRPL